VSFLLRTGHFEKRVTYHHHLPPLTHLIQSRKCLSGLRSNTYTITDKPIAAPTSFRFCEDFASYPVPSAFGRILSVCPVTLSLSLSRCLQLFILISDITKKTHHHHHNNPLSNPFSFLCPTQSIVNIYFLLWLLSRVCASSEDSTSDEVSFLFSHQQAVPPPTNANNEFPPNLSFQDIYFSIFFSIFKVSPVPRQRKFPHFILLSPSLSRNSTIQFSWKLPIFILGMKCWNQRRESAWC